MTPLSGQIFLSHANEDKHIVEAVYQRLDASSTFFDLPDMTDAADIHLRLKEDLDGIMSKDEIERQLVAFQSLNVDEQASLLLKSLVHWADLNQVIVLRTRWGQHEYDVTPTPPRQNYSNVSERSSRKKLRTES